MWEEWWADVRRIGGRGAPNSLDQPGGCWPLGSEPDDRAVWSGMPRRSVSGDRDEPGPPPTVVRNSSPATSGRVRLTVTWGVSAEVDPPTTAAPIARGSLVDCSSTAAAVGWVSPLPVESGQVAVPCRVDRRDVGEAGPSSCRVTSHPGGAVTITSPKQSRRRSRSDGRGQPAGRQSVAGSQLQERRSSGNVGGERYDRTEVRATAHRRPEPIDQKDR